MLILLTWILLYVACLTIHSQETCDPVQNGAYPNVLLQVSDPRTASTLQYVILIYVGSRLCHSKGFAFNYLQRVWGATIGIAQNKNTNTLQIIKTHDHAFIRVVPDTAWIFTTTRNELVQKKWLNATFPQQYQQLKFMQTMDELTNMGIPYLIEHQYAQIFNLSSEDVIAITETMKEWEKLRKCCGSQMSASWRNYLIANKNYTAIQQPSPSRTQQHNLRQNRHLQVQHECVRYGNLEDIEQRYLDKIKLYNLPAYEFTKIGQCLCTIELTAQYQYGFNHPGYAVCNT